MGAGNPPRAGCPRQNLRRTVADLVQAGLSVAVCEEVRCAGAPCPCLLLSCWAACVLPCPAMQLRMSAPWYARLSLNTLLPSCADARGLRLRLDAHQAEGAVHCGRGERMSTAPCRSVPPPPPTRQPWPPHALSRLAPHSPPASACLRLPPIQPQVTPANPYLLHGLVDEDADLPIDAAPPLLALVPQVGGPRRRARYWLCDVRRWMLRGAGTTGCLPLRAPPTRRDAIQI